MDSKAKGLRRVKKILRVSAIVAGSAFGLLLSLRGLVWLGERVPMIEPTGEEVVSGPLTTQPVRFAQTDFWFYPRRVDAEEGRLRVNARHDDPKSPTIELRYVRFPQRAQHESSEEATPVVYLAGGPGGLGVGAATGDRFPLFMKLRSVGDVIALDQRGTASSRPFPICPSPLERPLGPTMTGAKVTATYAPALKECYEHWEGSLDPAAFTTVESARDLEALRIALGAERLHLVGISYGTHLALAYIRLFPDRVGRAVLAGVEGPDHTWKSPAVVDRIVRAIGETLEQEANWPGFVSDIETGIQRLREEKPVVTVEERSSGEPVRVAIGPEDLKLAVLYGIGEREDFRKAAKRVRRIATGDYELLAQYALRLRAGGRYSVMGIAMDCASSVSKERRAMIEAEKATALIGDVANLDLDTLCDSWPGPDLGPEFRSLLKSDVPVLAVSGSLDSRTPPSNAEEALAGFSQMKHLIIQGGAHDDDLLISTGAIGDAMVEFLKSGDPGRDRVELSRL